MPESRDRLIRKEPETPLIFNRRSVVGGVWIDDQEEEDEEWMRRRRFVVASPIQFGATSTVGTRQRGRGRGRARARNDDSLPSWYPRRPLQDITAVVNAIERRRARLREAGTHQLASPSQQDFNARLQQESTTPVAGTLLEHKTPLDLRTSLTAQKLKDDVQGEFEFMTHQKKLLNSIDQVEKIMKEEFKRMKRTPRAKRAERDNKVRTLMTMR